MGRKRKELNLDLVDEEKKRLTMVDLAISQRDKYFPFLSVLDSELNEFTARRHVSPTAPFFALIYRFERSLSSAMELIRHKGEKNRILSNNLKDSILNIAMYGSLFGLRDGEFEYQFQCSLVLLLKHYVNAKHLSVFNSDTPSPKREASMIYMFLRTIFKGTRHRMPPEGILDTLLCSNIFDHGEDDEVKVGPQLLLLIVKEPVRYLCTNSATVLIKFLTLVKVYLEGADSEDKKAVSLAESIRKYLRRVVISELKECDEAMKLLKGFGNDRKMLYRKIKPVAIIAKVKAGIEGQKFVGEEACWVPSWMDQEVESVQIDTARNYVVDFDDATVEAIEIPSSDEKQETFRPPTATPDEEGILDLSPSQDEEEPNLLIDEKEIEEEEQSETADEEYEEVVEDVGVDTWRLQFTAVADVETDEQEQGTLVQCGVDSVNPEGSNPEDVQFGVDSVNLEGTNPDDVQFGVDSANLEGRNPEGVQFGVDSANLEERNPEDVQFGVDSANLEGRNPEDVQFGEVSENLEGRNLYDDHMAPLIMNGAEDVMNEILVNGTHDQEPSSGLMSSEIQLTTNRVVLMSVGRQILLRPPGEDIKSRWLLAPVSNGGFTVDLPTTNGQSDPVYDIKFARKDELELPINKCQVPSFDDDDDDDIQIVGEYEGDGNVEEEDVDDVDGEPDQSEADPRELAEFLATANKRAEETYRARKRAYLIERGAKLEDLSPDLTEDEEENCTPVSVVGVPAPYYRY